MRIEEVHHTQKKDAPSGTAITLAEGIVENLAGKQGWVNLAPGIEHAANRIERSGEAPADRIEIRSVREGAVPGIHTVTYESEDDVLEIRHTIKNRRRWPWEPSWPPNSSAENKGSTRWTTCCAMHNSQFIIHN